MNWKIFCGVYFCVALATAEPLEFPPQIALRTNVVRSRIPAEVYLWHNPDNRTNAAVTLHLENKKRSPVVQLDWSRDGRSWKMLARFTNVNELIVWRPIGPGDHARYRVTPR